MPTRFSTWLRRVLAVGLPLAGGFTLFQVRSWHERIEVPGTKVAVAPTGPGTADAPASFAGTPPVVEPTPAGAVSSADARRSDDAFAAFDAWLLARFRGEPASLDDGIRLARNRRAALGKLIAADPRTALANAVGRVVRAGLPPEIIAELERPIDAFGRFTVSVMCFGAEEQITRVAEIDGVRYEAFVFGRRLSTLSKHRLPIHGIAIDGQLAVSEQPWRLLEPGEAGAEASADSGVHVVIGDERQRFSSTQALEEWSARAARAESAPAPDGHPGIPAVAAAPLNWTFGEKTVLLIRVEFPDDPGLPATDAEIAASMADVDQFYRDISHGRCSLRTILVPGALKLTRTRFSVMNGEVSYRLVEDEAVALARSYDAANGNTGLYNPDRADRYVVIAKTVPSLTFLGIASVGTRGAYLNGTIASDVIAHELGHNHGLHHSHAWRPTGSSAIGAGTHSSYGDVFDAMGNTALVPGGHFNVCQKEKLLYLEPNQIAAVTAAGTYRLFRHDHRDAGGLQALKINIGDYDYWVEYRQQSPRHNFSQSSRLRTGIQLRWGRYPSSYAGNGTYLLDTTPTSGSGMDDAPIMLGETFSDPTYGLSITPLATGGTAPGEWIDVRIDFGANGTDNRNPFLAATIPFTVVPARTDITFNATASDPDGDTPLIRWDFGDNDGLRTGATVTHRYRRGGTFSVLCSAIDGRGGLATKPFHIVVDDPLQSWLRREPGITASFSAVIHDGRQFIAAGSQSLFTSPDGVTWTRRTPIPSPHGVNEMVVAGSVYISVGFRSNGAGGGVIAHSTDGLAWRDVTPEFSLPEVRSVAFGAGRFVAVGKEGLLIHSLDGITWRALQSGVTRDLWCVRYAAGKFLASGDGGNILTSADGLTWENHSPSTAATINRLAYFRGKWVATNGPNLWTSPDGRTWTQATTSSRPSFQRLIPVGDEVLLAPSTNDTLFYSSDGLIWDSVELTTGGTATLRDACAAGGTLVLVGFSGRIFQTRLRSEVAEPPRVASNPASQFVPLGHDITLDIGTTSIGTTYQWTKNGEPIEGAIRPSLVLRNLRTEDSGSYSVILTNFAGTTVTPPATVVVDPATARLVNLSLRTRAGTESDTLTVGFVVAPSIYTSPGPAAPKRMLLRGIGPALNEFGVPGTLADPRLELFDDQGRFHSNDDWATGTNSISDLNDAFRAAGGFGLGVGSKDAALLSSFGPKAYTIQLTGADNTTGVALAEIYDLDTNILGARITNVSARALVGTDADVLIGGFVLAGAGERTILIRAVGPGLGAFGVSGVLAEPNLALFGAGQTLVAGNVRWGTASNVAAIRAAAGRVGAFALDEGSSDSAVLARLPAGAYTIQISGVNQTTGVVLMEVYEVP